MVMLPGLSKGGVTEVAQQETQLKPTRDPESAHITRVVKEINQHPIF